MYIFEKVLKNHLLMPPFSFSIMPVLICTNWNILYGIVPISDSQTVKLNAIYFSCKFFFHVHMCLISDIFIYWSQFRLLEYMRYVFFSNIMLWKRWSLAICCHYDEQNFKSEYFYYDISIGWNEFSSNDIKTKFYVFG